MNLYIDKLVKYRYIVLLVLLFLLVLGKFHGSSIGKWDELLKEKTASYEKVNLIGKHRPIRSDEWSFGSIWYLAQCKTKAFFPLINTNIRSDGQNMLFIAYCPVFDISLIGKPANWGFFFLDVERGFSWWWFSRLFLLFIASFELAMILSGKDKMLSFVSALWISFSPAVQWWYSSLIIDVLYYSQFIIVFTYHFIHSDSFKKKVFVSILLFISITGFCLSTYPRYQVPMSYIMLLFIIYFLAEIKYKLNFKRPDYLLIALFILIPLGIVLSAFLRSKEAFNIMSNTVYPGKEVFTGGKGSLYSLNFFLTNLFLPFKEINIYNTCVVSTFFNFLPVVLILILSIIFGKYEVNDTRKTLVYMLFLFAAFQIIWVLVPFPEWFAKLSFFYLIKPYHLILLTTNLIGVYLSIIVFTWIEVKRPFSKIVSAAIVMSVAVFYLISVTNSNLKLYLNGYYSMISILFFGALNYFYITGKKRLLYLQLLIYVVGAGICVNPLARGLSSIYDKAVSQEIIKIHNEDPQGLWVSLNDRWLINLPSALGVKSFNGTHLYPDLKLWNELDTEKKYEPVYNRFADILVKFTDMKTYFELFPGTSDTVFVYLNWDDLTKANISYVMSRGKIDNGKYLREIRYFEEDNIYIYKVII